MAIEFKSLSQLVQVQLDYITANAPVVLSQPLGPFVTAVAYSTALVALVLQRLVKLVLQASRLATSVGEDVDTFVGDFGLSRLPAVPATGTVAFSRFVTAPSPILIAVGTIVQTDTFPAIEFEVMEDTVSEFDPISGAYVLPGGASSVGNVAVKALQPGAQGNVAAGAINKIGSPLLGVDEVINGANYSTGVDIESDEDLRFRFALYIQSLTRGTAASILYAVHGLQQGLIVEVIDPASTGLPTGDFTVVVDDGSGAPPAELLSNAASAVDLYRPVGVRPIVVPPSLIQAVIVMRVTIDASLVPSVDNLRTLIRSALVEMVNRNPIGHPFHYGTIYKAVWEVVSPGDEVITNILTSPVSTTTVLNVMSTEGMKEGQLLEIANAPTPTGALARIATIDDVNQITLTLPLSVAPAANAQVKAFSVAPGQIVDVHDAFIGTRSANTSTKIGAHTSTRLFVNSVSGFVINTHYIAVSHDYQSQTGAPMKVTAIGADYIDISPPIGMFYGGNWVAGGMVPNVFIVSTLGGTIDISASGAQAVRTRLSAPAQIYVGIELL